MFECHVYESIDDIGRERWNAVFPREVEAFDYLLAVAAAGLEGFRWRYLVAEDGGRLIAAAPAFLTEYALDTTLTGPSKRVVSTIRQRFPAALTPRLACIGSPCAEMVTVGFAPELDERARVQALRVLMDGFERAAVREQCTLLAVKDAASSDQALWRSVLESRGYRPIPGLPVAHLDVDFDDLETYLARLSPGTRKDMRRKLRALARVRIEVRGDLNDILDRVMELYRATRARAEFQFETLTPEYFTGVVARMRERAFFVLYYCGEDLLAVNLLLQGEHMLLDKFFCMDAERGRPLNLYFLSWFTNLRLCLERGLNRYQSGPAAYENKLRLGSRLTRTTMFFRHRNALVNGALRLAAPLLAPRDPVPEVQRDSVHSAFHSKRWRAWPVTAGTSAPLNMQHLDGDAHENAPPARVECRAGRRWIR